MKNTIKYLFQRLLGYPRYLVWFAHYKIHTLRKDNQEKDFFYFLSLIQPEKGAILDVGANIGIMTYHLSKGFPSNLIYAFEPIPSNIQALNTIIEHYELSNVRLLPVALGNESKQVEMVLPIQGKTKLQGLSHVKHETITEWNEGELIQVQMEKLDTILANESISSIKMDVENFEYFVLQGGIELLKKNKPIIYSELWSNENRTFCIKMLESLGYATHIVEKNKLYAYTSRFHHHQNFIFIPIET